MTWEETIKFIRTKPEFKYLVEKAYFEEDLPLNIERFRKSDEFYETLKLLKQFQPNAKSILDIGSGNGVSAISFALEGFNVVTLEPDASETIGSGAIEKLKEHYNLQNLKIYTSFAEELKLPNETFDIVYSRQCMHHAFNLEKFVAEATRVLKTSGFFITIRDHVVFSEKDKEWFLETHPLQKFYGGENAFTPCQYKNAMQMAGLEIVKELKYYDSIINYFPLSRAEVENKFETDRLRELSYLTKRIGFLSRLSFLQKIFFTRRKFNNNSVFDESKVPGRMYSYVAYKK